MRSRLELALLAIGLLLVVLGGTLVLAGRADLPPLALPPTVQPATPTPGPTPVPARGLSPELTPASVGSPSSAPR